MSAAPGGADQDAPALCVDDVRAQFDTAMSDMWAQAEMTNPRSWQLELGISALGGCEREAGYILTRTPATDAPPPNKAAVLGTWLHARVLPLLGDAFTTAVVEGEVVLSDVLRGHSDLYATVRADGVAYVAADLKTCTAGAISTARRRGPRRRHRWQVMTYARARRQAGERVDYVAIIYLDRASGDHWVWVALYDDRVAGDALEWLANVRRVAARNVDLLTRTFRGPGIDADCDGCRWSTRCYPGGQRAVIDTAADPDAALEMVLARRLETADAAADLEKDKKFYALALEGTAAGDHGPYHLRWKSNGVRLAQSLAAERLERHGLEVPYGRETFSPVVTYAGPPLEAPPSEQGSS